MPEWYVRQVSGTSPYNPHYPPFSLLFLVNEDRYYWPGYAEDAFWTGGSGRHCLYVVPSLNLVVWKLGGRDGQYSERDTGIPVHPDWLGGHGNMWRDVTRNEFPDVYVIMNFI